MEDIKNKNTRKIKSIELIYSSLESINIPIKFVKSLEIEDIKKRISYMEIDKIYETVTASYLKLEIDNSINKEDIRFSYIGTLASDADKVLVIKKLADRTDLTGIRLYEEHSYLDIELNGKSSNSLYEQESQNILDDRLNLMIVLA